MLPKLHQDTADAGVRMLVDLLYEHGVHEWVCSPGSRNTPILSALHARPWIKTVTVIDERCAAFIALGKIMATQRPVAVVCTSGTALLNYAPAAAEAFYQGLPLIVVSADRPKEWIDQDDAQTIRQYEALRNYVKGSYDIEALKQSASLNAPLGYPEAGFFPSDELWYINRIINEGMLRAMAPKQGPVHFNIRLSEPLNGLTLPVECAVAQTPDGHTESVPLFHPRKIEVCRGAATPSVQEMRQLVERAASHRVLIVAGFALPSHHLQRAVAAFAHLPNVLVMAETISNLHLPDICYAVDATLCNLTAEQRTDLAPDIVITFGGSLVSRMLKTYLRDIHPAEHWHIGNADTVADCFKSLSLRIECDEAAFLAALARGVAAFARKHSKCEAKISDYAHQVNKIRERSLESIRHKADMAQWSDLKAYRLLLSHLPSTSNLFLSNGTSIRYAQILASGRWHTSFSCRGVSGIDGTTAAAVGVASSYKSPTVLLTGDVSMQYDLSALASHVAPMNMRVAVINNWGGGIFRFISATATLPCRDKYLTSGTPMSLADYATACGLSYLRAESESELLDALRQFTDTESDTNPILLEIVTPPDLSATILRDLLNA